MSCNKMLMVSSAFPSHIINKKLLCKTVTFINLLLYNCEKYMLIYKIRRHRPHETVKLHKAL